MKGSMEWAMEIDKQLKGPEEVSGRRQKAKEGNKDKRVMYRLPAAERGNGKPCRVSLGPHFYGIKCRDGEKKKEDSLVHFLSIYTGVVFNPSKQCMISLGERRHEIRGLYDELDPTWLDEDFLAMMLRDACFILAFPRFYGNNNPVLSPIFADAGELKCYLQDMLLLDNQIPMLVFEIIHTALGGGQYDSLQFKLEIDSLGEMFQPLQELPRGLNFTDVNSLNILDLFRSSLVCHRDNHRRSKTKNTGITFYNTNIPSAAQLKEVGIGMATSVNLLNLGDIQFRHKILLLPRVVIDGPTKSAFLNVLAFEKLHGDRIGPYREFSSYIYFMGRLVQRDEDVAILRSRSIIVSPLSDAEVAGVFAEMLAFVDPQHPLSPEFMYVLTMIQKVFTKMSNEWRKDLYQKYLKSPWAIFSLVAASLLFALSVVQTVYAVLSYVHRK